MSEVAEPTPPATAAREHLERAAAHADAGRWDEALADYAAAVDLWRGIGEPAHVEGLRGTWRVDPAAIAHVDEPLAERTALLSPLDRLVFDRKRLEELFGYEYVLEMYKPKDKRRWGYFALPVLHEDRLVGKVDAAADRKGSVLTVNAIHEDVRFTRAITKAVQAELEALASWLGLQAVVLP